MEDVEKRGGMGEVSIPTGEKKSKGVEGRGKKGCGGAGKKNARGRWHGNGRSKSEKKTCDRIVEEGREVRAEGRQCKQKGIPSKSPAVRKEQWFLRKAGGKKDCDYTWVAVVSFVQKREGGKEEGGRFPS